MRDGSVCIPVLYSVCTGDRLNKFQLALEWRGLNRTWDHLRPEIARLASRAQNAISEGRQKAATNLKTVKARHRYVFHVKATAVLLVSAGTRANWVMGFQTSLLKASCTDTPHEAKRRH